MIKISVDEAHAFDTLSILDVKISNCEDSNKIKLKKAYDVLLDELYQQLSFNLVDKILKSNQYFDLKTANLKIFKLVDKIRISDSESIAKETDDANINRFICKKQLQKSFFDDKLLEVKI